jgi:hypothetical protein
MSLLVFPKSGPALPVERNIFRLVLAFRPYVCVCVYIYIYIQEVNIQWEPIQEFLIRRHTIAVRISL